MENRTVRVRASVDPDEAGEESPGRTTLRFARVVQAAVAELADGPTVGKDRVGADVVGPYCAYERGQLVVQIARSDQLDTLDDEAPAERY